MSEYGEYHISTMATYFEAAYVVSKGETVVRKGKVYGPFDSMEDAHSAAESAARGWIDQQGS